MDSYVRFTETTNLVKAVWTIIERYLKFICLILIIIMFALVIAIILKSGENDELSFRLNKEMGRVCYTHSCIKKAAAILNNMNASVDPCEDFHKFACTSFLDETHIPDDEPWTTPFVTFRNLVYRELRGTLEKAPRSNDLKPLKLAKTFYKSCMNKSAIEADGLKTIKIIINNFGGWPVLEGDNWYEGKFDWKQTMYALRSIGFQSNYFLSVNVMRDLKDSSRNIISIDEAKLEINSQLLSKGLEHSEALSVYFRFMVDVAVLFGANRTFATDELRDALDLESSLAKIFPTYEEGQKKSDLYNPITATALQKLYPMTNWKKYLKYLLDIPGFQLSDDDVVNMRVPKYLEDLENLLNVTSERVQANYIMWRVVSSSLPYLTNELRELKLNFTKTFTGIKSPMPQWKQCLNETLYEFWQPLKIIYDRKHFHAKSENVAYEMLSRIKSQFNKMLKNTEWMDEETKTSALEKAKSFNIHMKPFELKEDEDLNVYYDKLNLSSKNYLTNALAVSLFNNNKYFSRLREPVKDNARDVDISLETRLYLPGGIFHEDFFDVEQPHYVNYGSIGFLIGHIISHLYDKSGKNIDKNGELNSWWTNRTAESFKNKTKCLIEKFNNYTVSELNYKLSGRRTLNENAADAAGIKSAYLAYSSWIEDNGIEQELPGLNYTTKQVFWISLANLYCAKYRFSQLLLVSFFSGYVPCYYRIIGAFSNSEYFAKDFNCPVGSPMNPKVKCDIW